MNKEVLLGLSATLSTTPKPQPTTPYNFSWETYVLVVVLAFAVVGNLINIVVFASNKLKQLNYYFLFTRSILNFLLAVSFLTLIFVFCTNCAISEIAGYYIIAVRFYLIDCFLFYRLFIDLGITARIYGILAKNARVTNVSFKKITIRLLISSFLFYIQEPFGYTVKFDPTLFSYEIYLTVWGQSLQFALWIILQHVIRMILSLIIVPIFLFLMIRKFKYTFATQQNSLVSFSVNVEENTISTVTSNSK